MTRAGWKKIVFGMLFLWNSNPGMAQFRSVHFGVNGLTCSQCSRSVEMQLRKLPFVQKVHMDLENTSGKILFRDNSKVVIEDIARAVKDAGFSVRYLDAEFDLLDANQVHDSCFSYQGDAYAVLNPDITIRESRLQLKFIGKDYQPAKEIRNYPHAGFINCKGNIIYQVALINH